jgi:WD repeat-containing protein 44
VTSAVPWAGLHQERNIRPGVSAPTLRRHQGEGRSSADCTKGPEEKLPCTKPDNASDCLCMVSAAWNTVIVTASRDGVIRSFTNYGLPVRL